MADAKEIKNQFLQNPENRKYTGRGLQMMVSRQVEQYLWDIKEAMEEPEKQRLARETYYEVVIEIIRGRIVNSSEWSRREGDELRNLIEQLLGRVLEDVKVKPRQRSEIANRVYSAIRGFGLLDSIMADDTITEVMINGPDNVFVEQSGRVHKLEERFESEERLEDVIQRIVGLADKTVSPANPIADTTLPDGSRVNVVLPPVSLVGPVLTVRKFSKDPMTVDKLLRYGSITPEVAEFLKTLVEARYNIFISGGTGSGKTTFLNALSNFIPKDERIITIEDAAELQIRNVPNIVRMLTKSKNAAGEGEIPMTNLIKSSLRMRPDRIVVGEVRGGEALDMLQAMNTGHDGSISTGHANSTEDMLSRLETMVLQGTAGLPLLAIRQQISSAVDIIVHLSRMRDHSRKTLEITEVLRLDGDKYVLNPLYRFVEDTELSSNDKVVGQLTRTENKMVQVAKLRMAGVYKDF